MSVQKSVRYRTDWFRLVSITFEPPNTVSESNDLVWFSSAWYRFLLKKNFFLLFFFFFTSFNDNIIVWTKLLVFHVFLVWFGLIHSYYVIWVQFFVFNLFLISESNRNRKIYVFVWFGTENWNFLFSLLFLF